MSLAEIKKRLRNPKIKDLDTKEKCLILELKED